MAINKLVLYFLKITKKTDFLVLFLFSFSTPLGILGAALLLLTALSPPLHAKEDFEELDQAPVEARAFALSELPFPDHWTKLTLAGFDAGFTHVNVSPGRVPASRRRRALPAPVACDHLVAPSTRHARPASCSRCNPGTTRTT